MTGETADRKTNSQLVECEKGPKFTNKSITWLSTAQDGALRKTVSALWIRQKGALGLAKLKFRCISERLKKGLSPQLPINDKKQNY